MSWSKWVTSIIVLVSCDGAGTDGVANKAKNAADAPPATAGAAETEGSAKTLEIGVDPTGGLTLGGKPVSRDAAQTQLCAAAKEDPGAHVEIHAGEGTPLSGFARTMDLAIRCGLRSIAYVRAGSKEGANASVSLPVPSAVSYPDPVPGPSPKMAVGALTTMLVRCERGGEVSVNGTRVEGDEAILAQVEAGVAAHQKLQGVVACDGDANVSTMVRLIELLRRGGVTKLAISVQRDPDAPAPIE